MTEFRGSGCYEIRVLGRVPDDWHNRLGAMHCTVKNADGRPVSNLIGIVRDQAELAGVLSSLYALHLTLVSVQLIEPDRNDVLAEQAD